MMVSMTMVILEKTIINRIYSFSSCSRWTFQSMRVGRECAIHLVHFGCLSVAMGRKTMTFLFVVSYSSGGGFNWNRGGRK